ncbi:bis(5'-nucleosyl)-tetraphosphatase (symmetrical) ApaH [Pantoea sp. Aalb]|uniref:bis(5'-nucleosyl)-tetraphosphatase (symmetrical) ApaH n=1 Tax=Pantoea sp. Aalb TaxID=2576762 RepID=UPI00132A7E76|nr:bis(5'-nucleosyl)-tetraphosphatase (symmetrical) ApaH [Pantoea sp. Aalb]MXP67167.1 bis(5'-nucleosyl)-tetraphosphatase (symmetrical) [Pantoea sp. Aalb]
MNTYLIGDIHGCYDELCDLLSQVNFQPKQDELWLTGDLVGRGPNSLEVLRYIKSLGNCVRLVLGNHDLRLISIHSGICREKTQDFLTTLLNDKNINELIYWLRCQPLIQVDNKKKILMTHAGITPQWDLETAKSCAHEVETILASNSYWLLLHNIMYNYTPNKWMPKMQGLSRLCFTTKVLTKMRFCLSNGELDMSCKSNPKFAPKYLKPWFMMPSKIDSNYTLVFGHWASIEGKGIPNNMIGLDTGCCWGYNLTLLHWEKKRYYIQKSKIISF